jgi:hypothetical protein
MPVTYEQINIEEAKEYFLVPIQEKESLYYLGNKNKLNAMKIVMDAALVIATGGIGSKDEDSKETKCYIFLNTDKIGCEKILQDIDVLMDVGFKSVHEKKDNKDIK